MLAAKHMLLGLAFSAMVATAQAQTPGVIEGLPQAKPEEVGMSSARLARIGQVLDQDIKDGKMPGAVLAIARDGKLVFMQAYGYRDKAANIPMTTDTIFNIASMTKPMTTVGALSLVEQGKLVIDEPVTKYLPQYFTAMKVATLDETGGNAIVSTHPAARAITIRDLLTHTSGLIYGGRGATAVHKLYPAGSAAAAMELTSGEFLAKLSGAPLLYQPGTTWDYGFGLDVTGLIEESLSQESLGAHLSDVLFKPLGMSDTGFVVPGDKAARYAKALATDPETGRPQTLEPDATRPTKFECGGGCAVSTASDYLRFASMLLNHGSFAGHRCWARNWLNTW